MSKNKTYYLKNSEGQYYNIEDFEYLVECDQENARPNSEAMAKSFVSCNEDLKMEEANAE